MSANDEFAITDESATSFSTTVAVLTIDRICCATTRSGRK